ncbi:MAG: phosphonate C-P lyase system protein PhnL [Candidatus Competibacterales bacterium]
MPTPKNWSPPPCDPHHPPWVLQVAQLGKDFFLHAQGKAVAAAHDIAFTVHPGELVALVGPSGAGKSSLLKCIYRSYLPSSGRIHYRSAPGDVVDLATADDRDITALRAREIGFVSQFLHCLPRQGSADVVARPLVALGTPRPEAQRRARALLTRLGIHRGLHDIAPATFSGGERQRVNIARGLVVQRRLVLLDEPTASLDAATQARVVTLLEEQKALGVALVAVFHDPGLVERLADRVVPVALPVAAATAEAS